MGYKIGSIYRRVYFDRYTTLSYRHATRLLIMKQMDVYSTDLVAFIKTRKEDSRPDLPLLEAE